MSIRPPKSRSAAIERVRHRFEDWRRTRTPGRSQIPARLWAAAVTLAGQHGVYAISRALRLDYAVLKRRVAAAREGESVAPAAPHPTLIELQPLPRVAPCSVIEIEHPKGGRLRVPVPLLTVADLVVLTDGVWKAGSGSR